MTGEAITGSLSIGRSDHPQAAQPCSSAVVGFGLKLPQISPASEFNQLHVQLYHHVILEGSWSFCSYLLEIEKLICDLVQGHCYVRTDNEGKLLSNCVAAGVNKQSISRTTFQFVDLYQLVNESFNVNTQSLSLIHI